MGQPCNPGRPPKVGIGTPNHGDGEWLCPAPDAVPSNYQRPNNAALADRLQGYLMLVDGDADENAPPAVTLQFADVLIKANKTFDLLCLPNQTHNFFRTEPYYTRRMWDCFVAHLMGATPPATIR